MAGKTINYDAMTNEIAATKTYVSNFETDADTMKNSASQTLMEGNAGDAAAATEEAIDRYTRDAKTFFTNAITELNERMELDKQELEAAEQRNLNSTNNIGG